MIERTDILLDEKGDIAVEKGDFKTGLADNQHVKDILYACPGDYKQAPLIGANIRDVINGRLTGKKKNEIAFNLESDGFAVKNLDQETSLDELVINIEFESL